jgi:hypothetical protein
MTSVGLCPGGHIREILWYSILLVDKRNKSKARVIINESQNETCSRAQFSRQKTNKVRVYKLKRASSTFGRISIGAFMHFAQGASFARSSKRKRE